MSDDYRNYVSAVQDFHRAHDQAIMEAILARLAGRSVDLLSYEEVRQKLRARVSSKRELTEVPLDAIVGSVGRYTDFTRSFLPRRGSDRGRWASVAARATGPEGMPPITVYQVGDVYFVRDGHHRVSVQRQLGATHIQAYVTRVETRVPLTPDTAPDDLILKSEYAAFLERTRLDELRPGADLTITVPGQYEVLEWHTAVHRYFMGLEQKREIPYGEAVAHWYDTVYMPVVRITREQNILRDFPDRTESDLYIWVLEHRAALERELDWEVRSEEAAADLVSRFASQAQRVVAPVGERILAALTPSGLEGGPPPGEWRTEHVAARHEDRLFADILVAVNGAEEGWRALEIARRERARLHGLHVVPSRWQQESQAARAVQAEFDRRCEQAGVSGQLVIETGTVARSLCDRARWIDLVVLGLRDPPSSRPIGRLGSPLQGVLRRCPRPVLVVRERPARLDRALLAYDGSPKADEALFVATYLASKWQMPLSVVVVTGSGRATQETLTQAQEYLATHGVQAIYMQRKGDLAQSILQAAEEQESDLILMGGYGFSPILEIMLGSTVDQVLRAGQQAVFMCR